MSELAAASELSARPDLARLRGRRRRRRRLPRQASASFGGGRKGATPAERELCHLKRSLKENVRHVQRKDALAKVLEIEGCMGACIVDSNSGMMLGATGGSVVNLEIASAGNTEVVRAKRKTMKALALNDQIEDILITLNKQYHIIRPLASNDALFMYIVLDKNRSNLAMARHQLREIERTLVVI